MKSLTDNSGEHQPHSEGYLKTRRQAARESGKISLRQTVVAGLAIATGVVGVATLGPKLISAMHHAGDTTNYIFTPNDLTQVTGIDADKVKINAGAHIRHDPKVIASDQEGYNSCAQADTPLQLGRSALTVLQTFSEPNREWVGLPVTSLSTVEAAACSEDVDGTVWVALENIDYTHTTLIRMATPQN